MFSKCKWNTSFFYFFSIGISCVNSFWNCPPICRMLYDPCRIERQHHYHLDLLRYCYVLIRHIVIYTASTLGGRVVAMRRVACVGLCCNAIQTRRVCFLLRRVQQTVSTSSIYHGVRRSAAWHWIQCRTSVRRLLEKKSGPYDFRLKCNNAYATSPLSVNLHRVLCTTLSTNL